MWHNDGERFTMIVYRFEKNGIGPYVSRSSQPPNGSFYRKKETTRTEKKYAHLFEKSVAKIDSEARMKAWQEAHGDRRYMYGCSSKEALRIYFGGNFKPLFKQGFRIKRYKVPDNEIVDMGIEVAFPVKYHKLKSVKKIKEKTGY
jgi:hypothetical protein